MVLIKKIAKILLITVISAPVLIFILNYFLAQRLENYLKKELINRVWDATDHFYTLSFDDLSINLINGELKIEGLGLNPDPITFNQWKSTDSLPDIYLKAQIDIIDFKGINLIWHWNYKQLHFSTFDIKTPVFEVSNAYNSSNFEKKINNTSGKTLYELVKPYMDIITVDTLNLENASVSYNVENPLTPIIYKLNDVSFHAYGFRLDSLSSKSGKLLYADNFDFTTNRHQTLLVNNEFSILTDSITLNTRDSIIYLANIHLLPQEKLWKETRKKPSNYIDGQIKTVLVDGIVFKRENFLNYLEANNFNIYSPDIDVYNLAPTKPAKTNAPVISTDSLIQSLSLYQLISPILHSVSVKQISLEKTKANYSYAMNNTIETYHLDNFDFYAYDFLVDSLSEVTDQFWYSKYFTFEATGLKAMLNARNHKVSVDRVNLNTEKGIFHIENIQLNPISTQTMHDYMKGSIKSVNLEGLIYNNGISAKLFKIESPDIRYVKAFSVNQSKDKDIKQPEDQSQVDIQSMLNPLLKYLSIHDIKINNADFYFSDKNETDSATYKINGFNFFATNFLINENTVNRKDNLFFEYKDFGFNFRDFDNYILNNQYRLSISNAVFSAGKGLLLEDVGLIPQKKSNSYFSLKAPLIEMEKPTWAVSMNNLLFKMQSVSLDRFKMENAVVGFFQPAMSFEQKIDLQLEGLHFNTDSQHFDIRDIYFNTQNINIPIDNGFYNLHIGSILFDKKELKAANILLQSPYTKLEFAYKHPKHTDWLDISAGSFLLKNIDITSLLKNKTLIAEKAVINKSIIQNFKNRQIYVPKKIIPMIYENIQKAPFRIDIKSVDVNDMEVVYEELAPKGTSLGKLFFTHMNGVFHDFTNIVKQPDQYIRLEADGKLMGKESFTGSWLLPVDSLNDHFILNAHLPDFNLTALNELITPLAPVQIASGKVDDFTVSMSASSLGADINMHFLYNNLTVNYVTEKEGILKKNGIYSTLMNSVIRNNNPRHKHSEPHIVNITNIKRDPYHSTFNYIWQILRPAMGDAVGISYTGQKIATGVAGFFNEIKSLFHPEKKEDTDDKKQGSDIMPEP